MFLDITNFSSLSCDFWGFFSIQNQIIPLVEIKSFITIFSFSDFSSKFNFFQNLGSSGCNLLLVKELIWIFQLLQTRSPHRSLPCHLCCLLLCSISTFAGWSLLHVVPKIINFLPVFSKHLRYSHSHVFYAFFSFTIPGNWLCEVSPEVVCSVVTLFFSFLFQRCFSLSFFILCWRSQQLDSLSRGKACPFSHLVSPWTSDTWLRNLSHLT